MHFVLFDWGVSQSAIALYIYIELAILAFILPTSGHANFECQQVVCAFPDTGYFVYFYSVV